MKRFKTDMKMLTKALILGYLSPDLKNLAQIQGSVCVIPYRFFIFLFVYLLACEDAENERADCSDSQSCGIHELADGRRIPVCY